MLEDIAYPTTDAGVGVQAIVVVVTTAVALWLVRRSKDAVIFVGGVFMMTAALFGLRMLH